MSGPVWKVLKVPGTCSSCGETSPELFAVGTLVDFEFRPDSAFCPACYERYAGHRGELDQRAVADQRAPRAISRPTAVSDIEG